MAVEPDEYEKLKKSIFDFIWKELDPLEEQISRTGKIPQEELLPKFREHKLFEKFNCRIIEAYGQDLAPGPSREGLKNPPWPPFT